MNYVALYRKYRPETFDGVIGQDHIVTTLKNQIKTDKVSHAYLFCGTRGTGKTSTAKIFARAINCVESTDGNPCGKCDACTKLSQTNLDIIEMDAASNNGVDYARDIREKVQFPPQIGRYKVYIIDEVHMLSQGAFNALLKTLEEPPKHAVFILCTTEVHKIPATILSRCMRFDFRLVPTEQLADHVASIYDAEGKKYTREAVNAIAVAGEGSVRDSLSIADRCFTLGEGKLTYDDVMSVLGVSSREAVAQLADAVINCNTGEIFQSIYKLISQGKDVGRLCKDLSQYMRDALVCRTCKNAEKMLCLPSEAFASLKRTADTATNDKLLYAIDSLSRLEADLRFAFSPQTLLEAVVLRIASSSGEVDVAGLDRRLSRLESQPQNLNAASMLVVDRTNFQSIWSAVKVELERANKPLLTALWKEVDAKKEGEEFVITCKKGEYNLIMEEYFPYLQEILKRLVGMTLRVQLKEEQKVDINKQLSELGDNVKFTNKG
ncbi:MAG: DNA polymerase III subunit gamma/tau [Corallococcus sp.]|nr:DNA polymerase III subunit gamma/tau [Corallococcus sp.]